MDSEAASSSPGSEGYMSAQKDAQKHKGFPRGLPQHFARFGPGSLALLWWLIAMVAISGAVSFAVVVTLRGPGGPAVKAQESSSQPGSPRVQNVVSVEEAKQIVGYDIGVPAFIPKGFRLVRITVTRKPSSVELPPDVEQVWAHEDDSALFVSLMQDPILKKLGDGQPIDLGGIEGQKSVSRAGHPDRPLTYLSLLWRRGAMGFWINATLDGPLTEDIIMKVATSIR